MKPLVDPTSERLLFCCVALYNCKHAAESTCLISMYVGNENLLTSLQSPYKLLVADFCEGSDYSPKCLLCSHKLFRSSRISSPCIKENFPFLPTKIVTFIITRSKMWKCNIYSARSMLERSPRKIMFSTCEKLLQFYSYKIWEPFHSTWIYSQVYSQTLFICANQIMFSEISGINYILNFILMTQYDEWQD